MGIRAGWGLEMKQLTIDLEDDVFSHLEVRAAIDDMRIKEGVERLLTEMVMSHKEGRTISIKG